MRDDPREKRGPQITAFRAEFGIYCKGKVDSHWRATGETEALYFYLFCVLSIVHIALTNSL